MEQQHTQHADPTADEVVVLGYAVVEVDEPPSDTDLLERVRDSLREL